MDQSFKKVLIYILHLFALFVLPVAHAQDIIQPIGTLIEEWDPALVNQYLAKWDPNIIPGVTDPFDTRYSVSEVQPSAPMYFVRVYTEPNSGPLGSFIVRASLVRGLTPEQIRDILALPELPQKIDHVKVPGLGKYALWTGIAGKIMSPGHEWGNGGGLQTKIIGKETDPSPPADPDRFADYSRLPPDSYMNAHYIGNYALSYRESVSNGNAGRVADYLDHHLPLPYSDMEDVYTTLDFVNEDGPNELAAALAQISPIVFDSYSTIAFRNGLLFHSLLFKRFEPPIQGCSFWGTVAGEQGSQTAEEDRIGFYYQTGLIALGKDWRISPAVTMGTAAGYFRNHIGWNSRGNADINHLQLGIYSTYSPSDYFFSSAATIGFNWSDASRVMNFSGDGIAVLSGLVVDTLGIHRAATSHQKGQDLGLYLTAGRNIPFNDWLVTPLAQIFYFYSGQDSFSENGAQDLNLNVGNFIAQTIRTELAMDLSKCNTTFHLGWGHNFPLDRRAITANFSALGGQFSVKGFNEQTNELLAGLYVSSHTHKHVWIDAQYKGNFSHGFNSQSLSLLIKYLLDS